MYHRYRDLPSAKSYLEVDANGVPASKRLKTCVAILLYQMAEADGTVSHKEFEEIIRRITLEFHSTDEEAAEVLEVGGFLAREGKHLDRFLGEVNAHFDVEQREHLFDLLLQVANSDGHFSTRERELALFLREKLNLPLKA
jgi:uncharacterized tellurite resistance protein B-like protein